MTHLQWMMPHFFSVFLCNDSSHWDSSLWVFSIVRNVIGNVLLQANIMLYSLVFVLYYKSKQRTLLVQWRFQQKESKKDRKQNLPGSDEDGNIMAHSCGSAWVSLAIRGGSIGQPATWSQVRGTFTVCPSTYTSPSHQNGCKLSSFCFT